MVFALRLVLFERISGKSVHACYSVPFKRFEWYEMVFLLRFVLLERFSWDKTSN